MTRRWNSSPNDANGLVQQGTRPRGLGRHEEAIACYDQALELDPNDAAVWCSKGSASPASAATKRRSAGSTRPWSSTRASPSPGTARASASRASAATKALSLFDKALELDPEDAEAWYNKGASLPGLGRHEEAVRCLDKALELNPATR